MNKIEVIRQVAALPEMSTAELKAMWLEMHQSKPPPYNRAFLVKRLAHRIQELAMGNVDDRVAGKLERLAHEKDDELPKRMLPGEQLLPGTKLIRDWKGVEHCCTVLEDGFEYQGRRFGSLSAVANFITGTRWNGFVFFGLKKQGDRQ
ncbi:MAG: DUF2924 domain-containing protein [Magnetococcales bacterium]|nr:DUF2924 domain-containing protein [Magnetococcales bacterium]